MSAGTEAASGGGGGERESSSLDNMMTRVEK
jgi:hypothetical protein